MPDCLTATPVLVSLAETYELLRILEEILSPVVASTPARDVFGSLELLGRLSESAASSASASKDVAVATGSKASGAQKKKSSAQEKPTEQEGDRLRRALGQMDVVRASLARYVCCDFCFSLRWLGHVHSADSRPARTPDTWRYVVASSSVGAKHCLLVPVLPAESRPAPFTRGLPVTRARRGAEIRRAMDTTRGAERNVLPEGRCEEEGTDISSASRLALLPHFVGFSLLDALALSPPVHSAQQRTESRHETYRYGCAPLRGLGSCCSSRKPARRQDLRLASGLDNARTIRSRGRQR